MKISPINTYSNYKTNSVSFKHTAVPYPEFESYDMQEQTLDAKLSAFAKKVSSFFSPKVTQEADKIKTGIDCLYSEPQTGVNTKKQAHKRLVSILA